MSRGAVKPRRRAPEDVSHPRRVVLVDGTELVQVKAEGDDTNGPGLVSMWFAPRSKLGLEVYMNEGEGVFYRFYPSSSILFVEHAPRVAEDGD